MKTVGQMIQQLDGLRGTDDLNEWETNFVQSIVAQSNGGKRTSHLSANQVDKVEQTYRKYFA